VLSPVDLVPEAVLPFIGLADDAMVVAWLAAQLLGETDGFLRWERERAGQSTAGSPWAGSPWGGSAGAGSAGAASAEAGSTGGSRWSSRARSGARRPAAEDVVQGRVVR
jgi:hypothetical protein